MEEAAFLAAVQGIVRRVHVQHDALRLRPVPVQEQVHQQGIQPRGVRHDLLVAFPGVQRQAQHARRHQHLHRMPRPLRLAVIPETGAQPAEQPRPLRQLPQQQPAAIRPELPTVKSTDDSLPSQAPKFQSFRGTLCSHKVVVLLCGKLFITNQLYHKTRPYTLPLLRNPG